MTSSLDGMLKRTEQKLILRIGKSEAEVTLHIVLFKLITDRHEASCGLSASLFEDLCQCSMYCTIEANY